MCEEEDESVGVFPGMNTINVFEDEEYSVDPIGFGRNVLENIIIVEGYRKKRTRNFIKKGTICCIVGKKRSK